MVINGKSFKLSLIEIYQCVKEVHDMEHKQLVYTEKIDP